MLLRPVRSDAFWRSRAACCFDCHPSGTTLAERTSWLARRRIDPAPKREPGPTEEITRQARARARRSTHGRRLTSEEHNDRIEFLGRLGRSLTHAQWRASDACYTLASSTAALRPEISLVKYGQRADVHITRAGLDANPKSLLKEKIGPNEIHLARPRGDHRQGHRRDFLDCIRTRVKTVTPIEIGHYSAIPAHLGNIAMILGRTIRWDPKGERIVGDAEANCMVGRAMRSPWHL